MNFTKKIRVVSWLCAVLIVAGFAPANGQNFGITVGSHPITGDEIYTVDPPPGDIDLSHYNFMWVFEEGYYQLGDSVSHEWEPHGAGEQDSVVLWASKRYDNDNDPGERIGIITDPIPTIAGQVGNATSLSRDPRPGFESLYHFRMGSKYPVLAIITFHPLLSHHEMAGGITSCTRQYPSFTAGSSDGYYLGQKTHPELAENQVAFFASLGTDATKGFNRADLILPICTDAIAKMGNRVTIKVEVYLVNTSYASVIQDSSELGQIRQELGDLYSSPTPIYVNTLRKSVVSSWDPNSKSSYPDSVTSPGAEIAYQIQYENLGSAMENVVQIFDTIPDWLMPGIYEIEWDNPTTISIDSDANPATYAWEVHDIQPGETGHVSFKAKVKVNAPLGTIIRNRAQILFQDAKQDTLTNLTYNRVIEDTGIRSNPCDQCKDPCQKCKSDDCPSWLRTLLAILILLVLLLFILLVRAMRRRTP
jgi:hypothetical protein